MPSLKPGLQKTGRKANQQDAENPDIRYNDLPIVSEVDRYTPYDALPDRVRDLSSLTFERWTVLEGPIFTVSERPSSQGLRFDKWVCACSCGRTKKTVGGNDLRMGRSKGCAPCFYDRIRKKPVDG